MRITRLVFLDIKFILYYIDKSWNLDHETFMIYDLIIIGGSAAATGAGVYAARRGLNFKILTKEFGGEVATSGEIGNWPGIAKTDGLTLAQQFKDHLAAYGVTPEEGIEVKSVTKQTDGLFCVSVNDGDYKAKAIIVATGVRPKKLGVSGEDEFRNKGVTYCTTCDGPLFSERVTTVVGGGNSALEAGLMLAEIASKVYIVNKNSYFRGDKVLLDNILSKANVEIIYNAKTIEIVGDQFVTSLKYTKDEQIQELKTDGVFIHVGMLPNSGIVPAEVEKNEFGEIKVDRHCATNIPGLFAAGDVTDVPFNQIIIAAGQGCIAALSTVQYLNRK